MGKKNKKHKNKKKKHQAKRYNVVQEIKVEESGATIQNVAEEIVVPVKSKKKSSKNKENVKENIAANAEKANEIVDTNKGVVNEENKKTTVENKKSNNKKKWLWILLIIIFLVLIIGGIILYLLFRPKFKDATIEFGTTEIDASQFLVHKMYENGAEIVTSLEEINFSEVGDEQITLSYKGKEQTVTLHIVDTTAPTVVFQDIIKYTGYEVNAEDFIVEKSDLSEMTVEAENIEDTSEYKDYTVMVTVRDVYGNETTHECILTITWIRELVYIELGEEITKEDIIVNVEKDGDLLPDSELEKIDTSTLGEYTVTAELNGAEYISTVIVQDTTPPELELKSVTIYVDDTVSGKNAFIKSATDASGEVTTTMKTDIDYSIVGTQDIIIEAVDVNGNSVEKTTTLTIKKDTDGPVFSGLSTKTVAKKSTVDYTSGVKAVDAAEGTCEFTVDSSAVNTSVAGTYYATYTSKDSKGNTTTAKRKIIVNHDQEDVDNKFNEFYNTYLAGKSVLEMTQVIRTKITYESSSAGNTDSVWYGLTNYKGNCLVHARLLEKALNKAGITNMLIHTTNGSHYWNLVYQNGVWRHYDSTPGKHIIGPATDEEKLNSTGMAGRTWDTSAYPAAE